MPTQRRASRGSLRLGFEPGGPVVRRRLFQRDGAHVRRHFDPAWRVIELTKLPVEQALDAEMTEPLGHDKHEPVANAAGNPRNLSKELGRH